MHDRYFAWFEAPGDALCDAPAASLLTEAISGNKAYSGAHHPSALLWKVRHAERY